MRKLRIDLMIAACVALLGCGLLGCATAQTSEDGTVKLRAFGQASAEVNSDGTVSVEGGSLSDGVTGIFQGAIDAVQAFFGGGGTVINVQAPGDEGGDE